MGRPWWLCEVWLAGWLAEREKGTRVLTAATSVDRSDGRRCFKDHHPRLLQLQPYHSTAQRTARTIHTTIISAQL